MLAQSNVIAEARLGRREAAERRESDCIRILERDYELQRGLWLQRRSSLERALERR
jgi:hypothetical protein